jgi:hypothetical protein
MDTKKWKVLWKDMEVEVEVIQEVEVEVTAGLMVEEVEVDMVEVDMVEDMVMEEGMITVIGMIGFHIIGDTLAIIRLIYSPFIYNSL